MSFRDKVEGNELDLSLNELTDVPVKELAATPKATHLDLSCNRIQTLPNDFAALTHLVKIDLSRNKLMELPHNFGNLLNLQYLDLDRNELKSIPLSFCRLRNLRWLDLKDNPLDSKIKAVAGDCLDEKQCQECAKKVVLYMQNLDSNMEREKQKRLKEIREKEAVEKAKVEKELEEKRKLKKIEKEKRKAQSKARNEERLKQDKDISERKNDFGKTENRDNVINEKKKGMHWCVWFLPLICIFLAIVTCCFATSKDFSLQNISLSDVKTIAVDVKTIAEKYVLLISKFSIKFWSTSFVPFVLSYKSFLMKNIHSIMLYISNTASEIELLLSVYF